MKKIFFLLIYFLFILNVEAYSNDLFQIDIPEEYKIENNKAIYKWNKDDSYIAITVDDNTKLQYNVSSYTDEDINNYKSHLETSISEGLKNYNVSVNVRDVFKEKINDVDSLTYNLSFNSKEVNQYQKGNVFTTENYIITFVISSNKEINEEEYSSILNSLTIHDEKIRFKFTTIDMIALIFLIFILSKKLYFSFLK
ncbi:MAG: hypothetical protein IJ966_01105 [Bacilli bacterium]|nr:hypothetical protein [Bacilli bacterium]